MFYGAEELMLISGLRSGVESEGGVWDLEFSFLGS